MRPGYALITCVLGGALFLGVTGCSGQEGERTVTKPVASKTQSPATQFENQWVEITLDSREVYFGRVRAIDDTWLLLWDVYYPSNRNETGDTVLTRLGSEIHAPMPYMVIANDSVLSWQELTPKSSVLSAIKSSGVKPSAEPTSNPVDAGKQYATFMNDGSVLFGKLEHKGSWLGVKSGFYLARKDSATQGQPIASLDDLQLVAQPDARIGRADTLWVDSGKVLYFEPLTAKSPVVTALAKTANIGSNDASGTP